MEPSGLTKTSGGLRGRVLLGWMARDQATQFLLQECLFDRPITAREARRIWQKYRKRVEALPERKILAPARLRLSPAEREHAEKFLAYWRSLGPPVSTDVIKIDLSKTVIDQFCVVSEVADSYSARVQSSSWLHDCLPTSQPPPMDITISTKMNGQNTSAVVQVPHGECALFPVRTQQLFGFAVQQFQRDVRVIDAGDRLILKAGYHRAFARALRTVPKGAAPTALVALERHNPDAHASEDRPARHKSAGDADFFPLGSRPAFFSDFFADGLFMEVTLRQKRYELQVESRIITRYGENPVSRP
jgi:hypothetical protein